MANRLAGETSPYLLQHVENPVDWYPWGDEAFARAVAEDKPVFLSIGYSSCHWCHVMAHESFEDAEVAARLNRDFISIKVDREERPDVDEAYMTAVHLTSGRGGWPMSVFLTPDRKPFFAGTYFPPRARGQHPGFMNLLEQLAGLWRTQRAEVVKAADEISTVVKNSLTAKPPATFTTLGEPLILQSVQAVLSDFDPENGGFGTSPKFPPHSAIELLMEYALREEGEPQTRQAALTAALITLRAMAQGGIRDHVGGGFHRYSTDAEWLLPHFEKMLYDNALLIGNYARGAGIAAQFDPALAEVFARAALEAIEWLRREMTAPDGTFYSALDADSEGEEGRFYVWSTEEVRAVLGERAEEFLAAYAFTEEGNYLDEATRQQTGHNIPHLQEMPERDFATELAELRQARDGRVRPGLDNKALVGWNGLAIRGLAQAGAIPMAERAAEAIFAAETRHGHLPHQIVNGVPSGQAFLEDYAYLADACINLAAAAMEHPEGSRLGAEHYLRHAQRLTVTMVERFFDSEGGGFFGTDDRHEILFGRSKPVFDQPVPSANAFAIRTLSAFDPEAAHASLRALVGWIERAPQATEALITVAMMMPIPADVAPISIEAPAPVAATTSEVTVKLAPREIVAQGGVGQATVKIQIPEGLHLNTANPPARWLVPTKVEVEGLKATIDYPAGVNDRYEGDLEIPVRFHLASSRPAEYELRVTFQACTESECLPEQMRRFDGVVLPS